jgi:hypothetical protein
VANGKKEENTIFRLKTEDEEIMGDKELLDHATNYYKSLFGHSKKNELEVDDLLWKDKEKVSSEDNGLLCKKSEMEEIREAVFQMESNKAGIFLLHVLQKIGFSSTVCIKISIGGNTEDWF